MKTGTKKILLIDDDDVILQSVGRFLTLKGGYDVHMASSGLTALKRLEETEYGFDLVVTDLIIPDVSGFGIITLIKKKHPDIPVIAITGWGEIPEKLADEMKADTVIRKPFELNELGKTIDDLLLEQSTIIQTSKTTNEGLM